MLRKDRDGTIESVQVAYELIEKCIVRDYVRQNPELVGDIQSRDNDEKRLSKELRQKIAKNKTPIEAALGPVSKSVRLPKNKNRR